MASQGRNRPRSAVVKEDNADEQNLWSSIVERIKRCNELNKSYEQMFGKVRTLQVDMEKDTYFGARESKRRNSMLTPYSAWRTQLACHEESERLCREGVKLVEEELRILQDEPDDLLTNLNTLVSVRTAFEIEVPRSAQPSKPRNLKRRLDSDGPSADTPIPSAESAPPGPGSRLMSKQGSRSGSVTAASIKSENSAEAPDAAPKSKRPRLEQLSGVTPGADNVVAAHTEKSGLKFDVGSEVFFKNRKMNQEGEGILCRITKIIGEGKQRRYEVQDTEPELDEDGNEPPPNRTSGQNLMAIPGHDAVLPPLQKGSSVLALYPQTTTFYKAEVVSGKKDAPCRLRFEGEDEKDKEQEVERRFVLSNLG